MFFGNMQSFYRRNSLHSSSPNHVSPGGPTSKDQSKKTRRTSKQYPREAEWEEERKSEESESPLEGHHRPEIPIIKIGYYNQPEVALQGKKERCRGSLESDNSVRLGPNKNNIIKESLRNDKERQNACKH